MQVGTTKDHGLYNKPSAAVHMRALAAGTLPRNITENKTQLEAITNFPQISNEFFRSSEILRDNFQSTLPMSRNNILAPASWDQTVHHKTIHHVINSYFYSLQINRSILGCYETIIFIYYRKLKVASNTDMSVVQHNKGNVKYYNLNCCS